MSYTPGNDDDVPEGYEVVYCRYITRNGKRIFPKAAKFFRFVVKKK